MLNPSWDVDKICDIIKLEQNILICTWAFKNLNIVFEEVAYGG